MEDAGSDSLEKKISKLLLQITTVHNEIQELKKQKEMLEKLDEIKKHTKAKNPPDH